MGTLTSHLLVRLIDGVSAPARKASAAMRSLIANGNVSRGMPMLALQDRLHKAVERNNHAIGVLQGRIAGGAVAGYGLSRGLTPVIGNAMDFETVLEDIGQKADISGEKLKGIGDRIRSVGKLTGQSAQDVGSGVDFLLGMGLGGKTDEENLNSALDMSPAIGKTATAYRATFEDIARSSHAVFQNMQVSAGDVGLALDGMAKAGKLGGYELKDMAKDFPAITASAQFMGSTGVKGVADLAAALQVARKGARDGSQAANNLANFFQKFTLKETVSNFKKFGVDIYKELDFARKKGISPIEHMMNVLKKATKGNEDLVSQIFGDKQVLEFVRPMWDKMDEYRRIRDEALAAQGEVEQDFERRMKTSFMHWRIFRNLLDDVSITVGNVLMPGFIKSIGVVGKAALAVEQFAKDNPELTSNLVAIAAGLIAASVAANGLALAGRFVKRGLLTAALGARALVAPIGWLAGGAASKALGFFQTLRMRATLAGNPGIFDRIADGFLLLGNSAKNLVRPQTLLRGLMAFGPKGLLIAGAIAAIGIAANNLEGIQAFAGGFWDKFTEGLAPLDGILAPLKQSFSDVADYLIKITSFDTEKMKSIGESFGTWSAGALVSTIQGIVNVLSSVIDKAVAAKEAISNFFSSWGGGGASGAPSPTLGMKGGARGSPPGRSRGGRVSKGNAYIVGERRPELFTPGQSGYITPRVPEGGGGGASGPINITLQIDGAGDPQAVADRAMRMLEAKVRDMFRGIQADARSGFSY